MWHNCRIVPLLLGSHGADFVVWVVWLDLFSFLLFVFLLGALVKTQWLCFSLVTPVVVPLGMPQ